MHDEHGAAIVGARVALSMINVPFRRDTITDGAGNFVFADVAPGSYQISVAASNFSPTVRDLVLFAGTQRTEDFVLKTGWAAAEVSVTASYLAGTPESLNEVPGSIERISSQLLENARVFNFSEALRKISGVNVRDEEGFGLRPNIGVRGTNPTRSTKVLLLEDGIPLSYAPYGDNASYYHPPVERYESIEVLKGSGQIVYGPQTIAGVINYLTPNPPHKSGFNFKLESGNRSFFNGGAGLGGTFGKFGTIVNFNHKQGDGSRENTNFKLYDLASKTTYTIDSRQSLATKFTFFREDSNLTYTGATEAEFAADPRGNIFKNDFFYGRRSGVSLQHTAVLRSRINLTTNVYANYFSRDWWRQTSNSGERPFRLFRPIDPNNPISDADCLRLADLNSTCGNRGNLRDYLTTGVEPRLNINFDLGAVENETNFGFRIHHESQNRLAKYGDLPSSRDGLLTEQNERKTLAYAAFVQHRFILRDIAFAPGARIENINYERSNRLFNAGTGITGNTSLTVVVAGFGIAYSGLKNTTLFGGIHRGFAPPRVEDVLTDAGGIRDLDAELSWNFEVGGRIRPFRGVDLATTFFRNDYENQIIAASISSGTQFTSGGKTIQEGIEIAASIDSGVMFDSKHNFYLRAAYTDIPTAEFSENRLSTVTSAAILNLYCPAERRSSATSCIISGNRLPYVPRNQLTASVGYSHPRGLDAFVENVFIARQFGDDLGAISSMPNGQLGVIPAQTYWNATANFRVEAWNSTFFMTVKNLFDRTFIVDRSRGILPSQGRLVQAGVRIAF